MLSASLAVRLVVAVALLAGTPVQVASQAPAAAEPKPFDREYTLESSILGYRGVGGEIDGIRNPTLWALTGETVRITIVNAELMLHDIALDKLAVKSTEVLDKGASTNITFKAERSDTYFCSIPGHRAAGMEGRIDVSDVPRVQSEGVLPSAGDRALNLDFEKGTLEDWKASGDAFELVTGDRPVAPGPEKRVGHAGTHWVGSGFGGSARKGTLTSTPFRVTHPYASFLISGGAFSSTRVEVVLATPQEVVIYTISGVHQGMMRPAVVDLRPHAGKDVFIRLVDDETGASTAAYLKENPWAHINFDHFRFHESRPFFPNEVVPEDVNVLPPMDPVANAGLSGEAAARAMNLPPGFSVKLAAAEPDIVRPIAFTLDDRGRLWVAEAHTYPTRAPEGQGEDRILILEDTDGDGRLDRRKVFIEQLNLVSGLEVGFGGVWVGAAPYLMFIPAEDDRPTGPPQILLDGWGYQDTHETLNTFIWGPDGWLYGTHGVFTHSNVGKPDAPDSERQRLNAGIWRYHPTRHVFEVFAEGTSNPWGLDFNDYGHAFTTACVIEHLYHVVQGARYKRQSGKHFNPHIYDDIKTVADHVHWVGRKGPHAGNGRSDSAGGGHAHVGAMIYLGGDDWPREYRDAIFMNNIHGHRTNSDQLQRNGSGYTATHGPDFLNANDSWSQMLNFRYGPDGSVHVIDWYDKNQCHSTNPDVHNKTLGRIFKISHEKDRWVQVDLAAQSSDRLVELQLHRNDWYVRQARRILQERGPDPKVHARLKNILQTNPDVTRKLRALWALHVTEGLSAEDKLQLLGHDSEYLRSWAIALLAEDSNPPDAALQRFAAMSRDDGSALVRLSLASALQRVPAAKRWEVVAGLLARAEDAGDHNQPLMVWYAAEPLADLNMERALTLALDAKLPRVFPFMVQRIAAIRTQEAVRVLAERLARTTDPAQQLELVNGLSQVVSKPDVKK
jgi:putative membrane-bound dehydrogenase-like protein